MHILYIYILFEEIYPVALHAEPLCFAAFAMGNTGGYNTGGGERDAYLEVRSILNFSSN